MLLISTWIERFRFLVSFGHREARAPEIILQYTEPSIQTDVYGAAMVAQKIYYNTMPYIANCPSSDKDIYDNYILQWVSCIQLLLMGSVSQSVSQQKISQHIRLFQAISAHFELGCGESWNTYAPTAVEVSWQSAALEIPQQRLVVFAHEIWVW